MGTLTAATHDLDVMVVSFTGDSGLTDYSVSLCRELDKLGRIELVTAQSFDEAKYMANFPVHKLFRRTRHYPLDFLRFVTHVVRRRPRVLLLQSWLKSPIFELPWVALFRLLGIRMALTVHDLLPHYPKPWSKTALRLYYRQFDRLIAHSQHQWEGLASMGVTTHCLVVPHGVYDIFNTANFSRDDVREHFPGIELDDFVVLFFGRIDERKGIREFIHAANILGQVPGIKFVVAGRNGIDPANSELNSLLASCKTKENFIIHDRQIPFLEVQRYFAMAHVVVLPYLEGTTSGVLKLAMAFAKPVVATDVGDIGETVREGLGVLVGNGKKLEEDIANSILLLRANYAEYAERCKCIGERYQWCNIGKEYYQFLMGTTNDCHYLQ